MEIETPAINSTKKTIVNALSADILDTWIDDVERKTAKGRVTDIYRECYPQAPNHALIQKIKLERQRRPSFEVIGKIGGSR